MARLQARLLMTKKLADDMTEVEITMSNTGAGSKTFILGLGAQKCGTTWLHSYLSENANFEGGLAKEYHVWDAHDIPVMRHKKGTVLDLLRGGKKAERYRMQRDPIRYFDYFAGLFNDQVTLTADISPSYSGLRKERLEFIKNGFAERGIATKAVFLVRDPLNRIKSAVRYNLRKRNYNEGINRGETDFIKALHQYYQSDACIVRTSYDVTIRNALEVFGAERTYIGVYESMFSQSEIARLSDFCEVSLQTHLSDVYVKKTDGAMDQDPRLESEILTTYRGVYDYCFETIPQTRQLWNVPPAV
jgi:hypothetical protein